MTQEAPKPPTCWFCGLIRVPAVFFGRGIAGGLVGGLFGQMSESRQ